MAPPANLCDPAVLPRARSLSWHSLVPGEAEMGTGHFNSDLGGRAGQFRGKADVKSLCGCVPPLTCKRDVNIKTWVTIYIFFFLSFVPVVLV